MRALLLGSSLLLASSLAFAGGHSAGHAHHGHAASDPSKTLPASVAAYQAVNDTMHSAMDIEFTGDADIDFVLGMIPHHEGAVGMAQVVLEHGSDPEIRALAEAIIAAQEEEIAMMKRWLSEKGHH
ncbi:CopM family metallochaperone [Nitrincola tapanii]|uniref:DUF305 domain-containing protein n=1 Tax=Nitrincola tapanii TaxID=1708751 RepID=A0A5A9W428_9GAMM|nr:DUF305 domain-containing protein [Nitrincola tapanii]KAA0874301.1 DUF305 domain-containing protein [Nitrincola tapanii]